MKSQQNIIEIVTRPGCHQKLHKNENQRGKFDVVHSGHTVNEDTYDNQAKQHRLTKAMSENEELKDTEDFFELSTRTNAQKENPSNTGLGIGSKFKSHFEAFSDIENYCQKKFTHTKINQCHYHPPWKRTQNQSLIETWKALNPEIANDKNFMYSDVQVTCTHFGDPGTKCPFQIKFSYNKRTQMYIIRKFDVVHSGHTVNKETYDNQANRHRLTKAKKTLIKDQPDLKRSKRELRGKHDSSKESRQVAKSYSAALKQSTNFEGGNDECNEPKEIPSIDGSPKELPTESLPKTEADDPRPFVCDVCSRAFKTIRGLRSHQVCPLTHFFSFSSLLKIRTRTGSGDKLYKLAIFWYR